MNLGHSEPCNQGHSAIQFPEGFEITNHTQGLTRVGWIHEVNSWIIGKQHWEYPISNSTLMLVFQCMCTDRSKPNFESKIMSPYRSMQMRTERWIQLLCICWEVSAVNRCIEVEFDIQYFQWYVSVRNSCSVNFCSAKLCNDLSSQHPDNEWSEVMHHLKLKNKLFGNKKKVFKSFSSLFLITGFEPKKVLTSILFLFLEKT